MSAESQIAEFLSRYSPGIAAELRAARASICKLIPKGYELVYDNYNALVFGFGPTLRASEAVVSIAGYPNWVTLFFLMGSSLHDPDHLLQGTGSKVRSIRLKPSTVLESKPVQLLLAQALAEHKAAFEAAPLLSTVVKSVSCKQRPRRAPQTEVAIAREAQRRAARRQ
jgi:hypothetical protein